MINKKIGNIFESDAEALVNTVNTVGVMGKGLALQFKETFPYNFKEYQKACQEKTLTIGQLLVVKDSSIMTGSRLIINFPTKKHWRYPSKYEYIEEGMHRLVEVIEEYEIKSIAIPPLGAGHGGLNWQDVLPIIERYLGALTIDIQVYEPAGV